MTLKLIKKVIKYIEQAEEHFKDLYDGHEMPEIYFDLIKLQAVLEERERVKDEKVQE